MFRVVLCCLILALFSVRGAANPAIVRQCRAGTCDDRPVCPQSPCRCLYPSRVDCALYYLCEQGKPRQYRCPQGLLFNEDTLTCDYDFNVNCSIGKTTRTAESSTGLMTSDTGVTTSESSHSSVGTANTTPASTQSESYSKSTVKDDTTIPDTSIESTETSDFPTYSSSDTTYSKSSDFVTEITKLTPTTKQSEELKTTKSTSTTKTEESTETENPVSVTDESVATDTPKSIVTDKDSEVSETSNPSTTAEKDISETANPSTTKGNEVSETTNPSTTVENEVSETTNPSSTKGKEASETTSPSTTVENEVSETTNSSTTKGKKASETTSPSTTLENEVSETTNPSTTKEVEESEATISITTIATTSKTASVNGSTIVTESSLSTEEIQPEVTTSIQNWTCPTRFGLFPDQSDCHKFYHCSHWEPYHKVCPSKLHFNPALKVCDWPENAGCGSTASTEEPTLSTPSQRTTTISGNNASFCGCNSCELPIPNDCNSYILCIDQSATLISCGRGLNFNVKTGTCDWEENVVCETNLQCPRPMGRFPYPQSCYHFMDCNNTVMTINKCPEGMVYSKSEEKCSWTAVCDDIYTSTEKTSSAKYEGTTFMEISTHTPNSVETVKETSTGDTFTTYQDDASSKLNSFSTSKTMPTKRTDESLRTTSAFHPSTTRTEIDVFSSSFSTTYEETTTTEDLSNDQTTASDENDIVITLSRQTSTGSTQTSKFNKISTNESIITEKFTEIPTTASVPSESIPVSSDQDFITTHSTEFGTDSDSFSTEVDLSYSSTKVQTISTPTDLIISTVINVNASTSTATSTFELASSVPNDPATDLIITAEVNENESTYTATSSSGRVSSDETTANDVDSTDASTKRLVTIIEYSTEISKSPPTENHSAITEVTKLSTNTAAKITEEYEKSTSTDASSMTPSSTGTSGDSSFVCPSRFGLFPDPDSCFRFYHCSHWVAHRKWCPSGLHFNPKLQVCDWPYPAGCGGSPVAPTFETIQPKEEDIILHETCDCECCFYPNKTDCSKYTLCLNGVPNRGQCAEGLLFNPLDDNCDVAERVTCPKTPSSCPTPNAVYPHPALCTAFYRCVDGHPSLQSCPEDKHFKASEGKCTDPCDADCDKTLDCNRPPPPPTCSESDALLPSEGDCSSYYLCAEGHAYFVKCPDGTHFNSEYGVCEPPCDARCDLTIDCPSSVQHANSKSLTIPSTGCTKPDGLFPATDDCSAFYLCTKGRPHLLHCPPGFHYSSKEETCETPCNAQCDKNIGCTRQKRRKLKESLIPSSHLPLWLLCKTLNNGTLPNPKNCTSFYSCYEGEVRLALCPRGLHFDPEAKECKSPCLAGCDSSVQCPFEIPVPKGRCSCENCYLQDPADCSAYLFCHQGFLTKGYCPRGTLFDRSSSQCKNASEVECEAIGDPAMCLTPSGNFPHPGNCSKFVQCEDSVAHVMDCEAGLEFDPTIRACANPKGHCGSKGKDPLCGEATGQIAHPQNSSLFYRCENGTRFLKSCSPPLIYNALDQVCDWPHKVQDKSIEEILKSQKNEDEITRYSSIVSAYKKSADSSNSTCRLVGGVTCPCACRVTTYDDCDSFYQCRRDGKACKRHCPEGLYFNRRTMVCDLPQNVECRDFFFATLRRLRSANVIKASLKFPFQAVHLPRTSELYLE